MAKTKIALLYEQLSRDDDKSKVHKHKSLLSELSDTCEQCRIFY